jgi:aminoglycoside phosphotransferase (APT) family kinase protein
MNREQLRTAFDDERLRGCAEHALGRLAGEVQTVERIERGNRKQTAIARFADRGPVVVQLCTEQTWLQSEATLLAQITDRTTVPVPPVLASGLHDGIAYMLTDFVPGEDLHTRFTSLPDGTQRELVRNFGGYLAQLHDRFRFESYGTLVVTGDRLAAQRPDWGTWLQEYGRRVVSRLPPAFEPIRTDCRELYTGPPIDAAPTARLYPWDFRPGNALIADDSVTAILDWEAPLAAPASLSVAKAEYLVADWYVTEPEPLREAFRSGYESVRPYPSIPTTHRVAAIADTAVDSNGAVTNPGYPELGREEAVAFHRRALEAATES